MFSRRQRRALLIGLLVVLIVLIWYLRTEDRIVLASQTGSDLPVILLDGFRSACDVDDEMHRGTNVGVGNMVRDDNCLSEIAVFAQENAMNLTTPVVTWTTSSTDVVTVSEAALLRVPVKVWTLSGIANDAVVHVSKTNEIYNKMRAGLLFERDQTVDATQTTITVASCENLTPLEMAYPPVPQKLNVYYVPRVTAPVTGGTATMTTNVNGRWCANDPNIILIGSFAPETLAHELGHSLTLDHVAGPAFDSTNLMWPLSTTRTGLSIGQALRINANQQSAINRNGIRAGATRTCPDTQTDARCPALATGIPPL